MRHVQPPNRTGPRHRRTRALLRQLTILAACAMLAGPVVGASPPNIILINIDDLDFNEVGAYPQGRGKVSTPHMDSLIQQGVRFDRAYTVSAVCVPSRYATLTGRYPSRAHVFNELDHQHALSIENVFINGTVAPTLEPGDPTIAQAMKAGGYTTALIGKHHNDRTAIQRPLPDLKLPTNDPRDPETAAKIRSHYDAAVARVRATTGFDVVDRLFYENKEWMPIPPTLRMENTAWITEGAIDFIRTNRERPFFLYYANPLPHDQLVNEEAELKQSWGKKAKGNMTEVDLAASPAGWLAHPPTDVQPSRADAMRRAREAAPDYYPNNSELTWLDDSIGAILKELRRLGLEENTIIVLASDHQSAGKFTPYEDGVRIPLAVYWKGHLQPAISRSLVSTVDFVATLAELGGFKLPADYPTDGVSFAPILADPQRRVRDSVYAEIGYTRTVITQDWKYIAMRFPADLEGPTPKNEITLCGNKRYEKAAAIARYPAYCATDQVYDLRTDPAEQHNLWDDPATAKEQARLVADLKTQLVDLPHAFGEFSSGKRTR